MSAHFISLAPPIFPTRIRDDLSRDICTSGAAAQLQLDVAITSSRCARRRALREQISRLLCLWYATKLVGREGDFDERAQINNWNASVIEQAADNVDERNTDLN